jgi:hypothetical protein
MNKKHFVVRSAFVLFLVVCAIAIFSSRVAGQDDSWQILRADYGWRQQRIDVTNLMRDLLFRAGVNGRVAVNNQIMGGDPAVGKDKTLRVFARNRRGDEKEFAFNEGSFIDAAMFHVRNDGSANNHGGDPGVGKDMDDRPRGGDRDWDSLSIIYGFYGAQRRTANVTDLLRARVRDGSLSIHVDNNSLGEDPAVGADKVLIVIYRYKGREQAVAIGEGYTLSLP